MRSLAAGAISGSSRCGGGGFQQAGVWAHVQYELRAVVVKKLPVVLQKTFCASRLTFRLPLSQSYPWPTSILVDELDAGTL